MRRCLRWKQIVLCGVSLLLGVSDVPGEPVTHAPPCTDPALIRGYIAYDKTESPRSTAVPSTEIRVPPLPDLSDAPIRETLRQGILAGPSERQWADQQFRAGRLAISMGEILGHTRLRDPTTAFQVLALLTTFAGDPALDLSTNTGQIQWAMRSTARLSLDLAVQSFWGMIGIRQARFEHATRSWLEILERACTERWLDPGWRAALQGRETYTCAAWIQELLRIQRVASDLAAQRALQRDRVEALWAQVTANQTVLDQIQADLVSAAQGTR